MSGNGAIEELWRRIGTSGDGRYQVALTPATLVVTSVARDSTGAIVAATGALDGQGEFTVPLKGRAAGVGDHLLVTYPGDQPVGAELTYVRHVASDNPGAGYVDTDANLPPPLLADPPWVSSIVALPGSITAKATVRFAQVEARYFPSGYTLSVRVDGGDWINIHVPHEPGQATRECDLGNALPPGVGVDVRLRTKSARTATESALVTEGSFETAHDTSSPGDATALAVAVVAPGALILDASGTVDPALFRGWRYEVSDAATGPPDLVSPAIPGPWAVALPAGAYYVAARPVSKAGALGGRFPATGYQGPHVVPDYPALDTTPPPTPPPPLVAVVTWQDEFYRVWHRLTISLDPGYAPPADFAGLEGTIEHVETGNIAPFSLAVEVESLAAGVALVDLARLVMVDGEGRTMTGRLLS